MTCYFRHIRQFFDQLGVEVTKENKSELDRKIHEFVGIEYKNCSEAWKQVKKRIAEDEAGFIAALKKILSTVE